MKKLILVIFLLIPITSAFAQQLHTYKGEVINAADNSPLEYANILIEGTSLGTVIRSEG